jgi:hypothetical protein
METTLIQYHVLYLLHHFHLKLNEKQKQQSKNTSIIINTLDLRLLIGGFILCIIL